MRYRVLSSSIFSRFLSNETECNCKQINRKGNWASPINHDEHCRASIHRRPMQLTNQTPSNTELFTIPQYPYHQPTSPLTITTPFFTPIEHPIRQSTILSQPPNRPINQLLVRLHSGPIKNSHDLGFRGQTLKPFEQFGKTRFEWITDILFATDQIKWVVECLGREVPGNWETRLV